MLFLITTFVFLIWAVYVIRKGHLSAHTVFAIYTISLVVADYGDATCDYWLDFYDLPTHLLIDTDAGEHLGLILSDGVIFPLIGIVFCYYAARYQRPWLTSLLFAVMLGLMEFLYVTLGFMVYHHWTHFTTAALAFPTLMVMACFAKRFIGYNPPVPYRLRLACAVYTLSAWPVALLSGILFLFEYTPLLAKGTANDPLLIILPTTAISVADALLVPSTAPRHKMALFLLLGVCSSAFALVLYGVGMIQYNHWNSLLTAFVFMAPYPLIWLFNKWEWRYTRQFING